MGTMRRERADCPGSHRRTTSPGHRWRLVTLLESLVPGPRGRSDLGAVRGSSSPYRDRGQGPRVCAVVPRDAAALRASARGCRSNTRQPQVGRSMASERWLYLFSSNQSPLYEQDILDVLAAPTG